jgi:hypothetical protein
VSADARASPRKGQQGGREAGAAMHITQGQVHRGDTRQSRAGRREKGDTGREVKSRETREGREGK